MVPVTGLTDWFGRRPHGEGHQHRSGGRREGGGRDAGRSHRWKEAIHGGVHATDVAAAADTVSLPTRTCNTELIYCQG